MARFTPARVRRGLRRRLGRLVSAPRVTVVVWVPAGAAFLDACVASVRASAGVVTDVVLLPETGSLSDALGGVTTDRVAFASADDVLAPEGLSLLVDAMTDGIDVVSGRREAVRAGRVLATPPPGSDVDLTLTGKLFRRELLSRVHPSDEWHRQPVTVAALTAAARATTMVDTVVVVEHDRDTALPIRLQRRFRPDLAAGRIEAFRDVLRGVTGDARHAWREQALVHLLPGLCRDAVGGGPSYHEAVQGFALDLVAGGVRHDRVPVASRIAAWVAAHGTYHDLALTEDLLAAHPHGLPVTAGVVVRPEGLSVELLDDFCRLGAADRTLRSRVLDLEQLPAGRVAVRGNAFVAYETDADLPVVTIRAGGLSHPVPVDRRHDERANAWAQRAFEDRRGSGFEGSTALPAGDGPWDVRVELAGHVDVHRVPLRPHGGGIDEVDLVAEGLRVAGAGAPVRLRLAGPGGTTPWADASTANGRFEAVLALVTNAPWGQTRLPGGRYRLEVQGARGEADRLDWSAALLAEPPDLVDHRLALALEAGGLRVEPPLGTEDRSAHGQQARTAAYASAPGARARQIVLLESFHGRAVSDNPAAIGRALAAREPGLDLVWVVDDPTVEVPGGTRAVARRTAGWFEALADAHAYVGNAAAPPFFAKKPGQLHLQTWHGTPLKRIGEDRGPGDLNTWRHRRMIARQAADWDGLVSPSRYCSEIFRSAFRYDGPLLEIGYPRNDLLLSDRAPEVRAATRTRLGVADHQRVVLYAPTWREYLGVRDSKPLFLDPARVVASVPDAVVLVRGHYNATRQPDLAAQDRILDVTRYPDIADLYLAADALVTDYSSVMFDFALTDRPIVLLTPDLEQYRDVERGFYVDIESVAPGPLVTTTDDVVRSLLADDVWADARERFRARFCPWDDGHAAERAVDHLLERW